VTITIHKEMIQGSDEWFAARLGLLTASEMHLIVTPTLKAASNEKERSHMYELMAQRITRYVEPSYVSDAMLRGQEEELDAVLLYSQTYKQVDTVGFMTNDKWGFTIGYSPDGLVGVEGQVECKSRSQKWQMQTYLEYVANEKVAPEFLIQVQTGLLVSEREWCDLISYCGGLPMATVRVYPDKEIQDAIISAATAFEQRMATNMARYQELLKSKAARLLPTKRRIYEQMI